MGLPGSLVFPYTVFVLTCCFPAVPTVDTVPEEPAHWFPSSGYRHCSFFPLWWRASVPGTEPEE